MSLKLVVTTERLDILCALLEKPMTHTEIVKKTGISTAGVSKIMDHMMKYEWVNIEANKKNRSIQYVLTPNVKKALSKNFKEGWELLKKSRK